MICRYTNNMILAVTLLEAYERQIQSVEGALRVSLTLWCLWQRR